MFKFHMRNSLKETIFAIIAIIAVLFVVGGFVIPFVFGFKIWLLYEFAGIVTFGSGFVVLESYENEREKVYNSLGKRKRLPFLLYAIGIQVGCTLVQTIGILLAGIQHYPHLAIFLLIILLMLRLWLVWLMICNYAKRLHDVGKQARAWVSFIFVLTVASNAIIGYDAVFGFLLGLPVLCIFLWLCIEKQK